MNSEKIKLLWLTDPHILPWNRHKFLNLILDDNPAAILATGDLTYGPNLYSTLDYLGERIGRPFYFCLGNHDEHFSSIEKTHQQVRELCQKHKNLIWMQDAGVVSLTEEVGLIGDDGWYDCRIGDPQYIKFTLDWFLTSDFKNLPDWDARFAKFRELADRSAERLAGLLEMAIEQYHQVFLLTHMPPWREANRSPGTLMENFWLPYNVNYALGQALEKVMQGKKKRKLVVYCGHTHEKTSIFVSRNIECRVGSAHYFHLTGNETIYI